MFFGRCIYIPGLTTRRVQLSRLNLVYKPIMSHIEQQKSMDLFVRQITLFGESLRYFISQVKAFAWQIRVNNIHLYHLNKPLLVVVVAYHFYNIELFLFCCSNVHLIKQYESLNYNFCNNRTTYFETAPQPLSLVKTCSVRT